VGVVAGKTGDTLSLPIHIANGMDIRAFSLELRFDVNQIQFIHIDRAGTATENFSSVVGVPLTDRVVISGFAGSAGGIEGNAVLFKVIFTIQATALGQYPITPENFLDDIAGARAITGWIEVVENGNPIATATVAPPTPPAFTPTATQTPIPTFVKPLFSPTPTPFQNQSIFIYDNAEDTSGDLTGQTDFDAIDHRNLTIAWNMERGNATDWHIYMRYGLGGMKFLGRTGDGAATRFHWYAGGNFIDDDFINGPDFNSVYLFRVIRIDGLLGPDDFFEASAPVGFNLEGGNPVSPDLPEIPNLTSNRIVIYDDILGGDDLAPMGSTGSDVDPPSSRAIQIAWNFGRDPASVNDYHVLVSVDGGAFDFLGQTYTGRINYFRWSPQNTFRTNTSYANGPQDGHTYQFMVALLPLSGGRSNLKSGVLTYAVSLR